MKKLFNDKIIIMKDSELEEIIQRIDKEKEYKSYLMNKNWEQKVEIRKLKETNRCLTKRNKELKMTIKVNEQLLNSQKYKIMNLKSQIVKIKKER